jgi:hypothetical protein
VISREVHPAGDELHVDTRLVHPLQACRFVEQGGDERHAGYAAADFDALRTVVGRNDLYAVLRAFGFDAFEDGLSDVVGVDVETAGSGFSFSHSLVIE